MHGSDDLLIEHIEYDSRLVKPNTLFFAVKGFKQDGHDFLGEAKEKGAVAALGERESFDGIDCYVSVPNVRVAMSDLSALFYGHPGRNLKVCGVTGTNGKTTTCHLIKSILEARNKTVGLISSSIYDTGKEKFEASRTTPESLDLQRLLYLMKNNHCVNAVVEVSSHALTLNRVDNINFRVAVMTNLTQDHLDFHKTMEDYLEAKAQLLKKLDGPLSYAVINIDVPEFRKLMGDFSSSYISFSLSDKSADVFCVDYEIEPDKTTFDLSTPMGVRTITLRLPGKFNLINAIAAASGGLACGIDIDNIVKGLEKARSIEGRFNYIESSAPFSVYVDYAHTPDALERLCETVREIAKGKILLLFGCGGDRDKGKRPLMGKAACEKADFAIVTSDNPRSEEPQAIIDEIKPGLIEGKFEIVLKRREAIETILQRAKEGDVVLLAGRGAESHQEIDGKREPFDDTSEALKVLGTMGYRKVGEEI